MARKLKVFRTAAGFNDAYVAASSRKAALRAWGADVDLFARGIAEEVSDPELTAEPLAKAGEVIMRSRGGLAEQLKALGPKKGEPSTLAPKKPGPRTSKPPSRARIDRAEEAIARAEQRYSEALQALEEEREQIERRIAAAKAKQAKENESLERRRLEAEQSYRDALDAWSG